ncbi:MAG: transcriptional regulator NrdR [Planctomycetota bacterium]|jgi:transcriptional repressor NrdR
MKCPFCKADDDRVVDSRASADGFAIRRRRECLACGRRYTTYERIEESPIRVVKKDGSREPLDRRKVLSGLMKACEKRPVSMDMLDEIVSRIENQVTEQFDREVPSNFIGRLVMRELKKVDQVAYVRFASVYRDFKDVAEFVDEIRPMLKAKPKSSAKSTSKTTKSRKKTRS